MDYFIDIIKLPQDSANQQSSTNQQGSANKQGTAPSRDNSNLAAAFNFANSCRDKEIDRFWTRGLYFWGFITASFAAYMAVFNIALGHNENGVQNALCLQNILAMSFMSKFVLFVLAFICFVFCLSWQLAHKASKYWQESWEKHIKYLEEKYIGMIYDSSIILKKGECPFSLKPYNYSVSKISSLCSILLLLVSMGLFIFHGSVLIASCTTLWQILKCCKCLCAFGVVFLALVFIYCFSKCCIGNKSSDKSEVVFRKAEIPPCRTE